MNVQVGHSLPGRRLVLGRSVVRSALGEHALPHVFAAAAARDLRHSACGRPTGRGSAGVGTDKTWNK